MSGVFAAPSASHARLALLLLTAPALLWLVGLIVLPHLDLAVLSLRERVAPREYAFSLNQYRTFIDEPLYWHTFVRTAAISIFATLCTLLIAFPAAWYIAKIARGRARSLLFVLCLIPFWVSETVRTLGWMILLRESGVLPRLLVELGITKKPVEMLYHDATILVGLVYTSMLFMVVPLVSTIAAVASASSVPEPQNGSSTRPEGSIGPASCTIAAATVGRSAPWRSCSR